MNYTMITDLEEYFFDKEKVNGWVVQHCTGTTLEEAKTRANETSKVNGGQQHAIIEDKTHLEIGVQVTGVEIL